MTESGRDSLLGNKIAAGLLTAGLIFWGANRVAHVIIPDDAPRAPAIALAGLTAPTQAIAAQSGPVSLLPLLAGADIGKGQALVQQQCAACHTVMPQGANGVGPNLYGIVGAAMFSHESFTYSDAVKGKAGAKWSYETLNAWLASPATFAPGTAMSYAGIKNDQTRADVVAYLRGLSTAPVPLPSADDIKAAQTAAAPPPAAPATPAQPSLNDDLANADIGKGQAVVAQQCAACHTLAKGGADGVGPNLYGILQHKAFSEPGFGYSSAVSAKAGTAWTVDSLSDWLKSPNSFASGTAMSFAGLKNDQTRADVIAYLNKNSDAPAKLP